MQRVSVAAVISAIFLAAIGCGGDGPLVTFHNEPLNDGENQKSWEIEPSELFGSGKCQLPDCDENAEPDITPEGTWRRILQTTGTNCGDVIKNTDDRANEGARNTVTETVPELRGNCVYHEGDRVGTVRRGTLARCIAKSRRQGVTSYSAEVVDFDDGIGTGRLISYLRGIPSIAGGDCQIERDVRWEEP